MGNVTGSAQKETLSYKIGDFRVIRELGSGGFAKVYLAEDEKKNLFALKVFYSAEQSQSFENEFQTQKSLQHEGVVECFELFFDETARGTRQYCLVQEYCEAGDLLKHISKENAIPIDLMMKWFIFLIETLAFIHSKKIIHRDIKPENILITADSAVKFSDFGIATKKINAQTKIGTEYYVAPEVVSEQSYDAKVDIWSLGCVLYQCIIGDKSNVKFREAAKADFPLVKDESIKAILRKMLQVNHHQRPTAEELLLDPCVIGWKVALALPLTASQRPYAESSHTLAPMLSILINGSLPGRLQVIETLHRSTSLNIAEVRAILLTSGALLSLLEKAGETAADLERVLKCLEPFGMPIKTLFRTLTNTVDKEGSELRQARCLEPLINYLEKRKSAQLVPLIIRVAKQDPGSRALISSDQRTFGICKSLINSYPDMTVLVRDPVQLIKLVEQLSGSQEKIDTAVKEYFISHTLPANKRSELLKLAMNSNMFSVLYHNIFDWNTVVNSALKKKICLDDLTENVRSQHAVFGCRSCDLNQAMDVLCIVCALHSHAQHELENKPSSVAQPREGCMGARAHSRQLHPLSNTLIPSPQKAPLETGYSNPAAATIQIDKDVICGTVERPISLQSSIAINKTAECFYFEVTAKTTGFTDSMSIGISRLHYSPEAFPGWEQLSIGYQSNGKLYLGDKERGKVFGYRYKAGDVIGCGVHPSGSVFFTLNGIFIGFCDSFNVFARSNQTYFPTIGMHNGPFELEVNFGAKPFLFPFIFTDDLPKIDKWPASVAVLKELDVNLGALVTKLTHVTERQTIFQLILCINALVGKDLERRKIVAQAISKPQLLQYLDKHHSNTPMTCRIVENWFDIPNAGKPAEPRQQMPTAPIPSSKVPVPGQRNRGSDTILLPTEKITFFVTAEGKHGKYTVKLPRVGLTVAALKEAVADELDEPVEKIKALLYFVVRKNKREPEEVNITRSTLLELVNESDIKAVL